MYAIYAKESHNPKTLSLVQGSERDKTRKRKLEKIVLVSSQCRVWCSSSFGLFPLHMLIIMSITVLFTPGIHIGPFIFSFHVFFSRIFFVQFRAVFSFGSCSRWSWLLRRSGGWVLKPYLRLYVKNFRESYQPYQTLWMPFKPYFRTKIWPQFNCGVPYKFRCMHPALTGSAVACHE